MNRAEIAELITRSSNEISPLHKAVHYWAKKRDEGVYSFEKWGEACQAFRDKFNELAFIGGWATARDRIRSGDKNALEYALCFIEIRPYFFRSGYMFTALIKCLNSVDMSQPQRTRYDQVKSEYLAYRRTRRLTNRCTGADHGRI